MTDEPVTTVEGVHLARIYRWNRHLPAIIVAAVALLAIGFLAWQWHGAAADRDALRAETADRDTAARIAKEYTKRSLTYDYQHLDAFFAGVKEGATEALVKRYDAVRDPLTKIMTGAQVVATGTIDATAVQKTAADEYRVTVFATQKTQNTQHQEPVSAATLLTVAVRHEGDRWLVADYHARD